MSREGRGGVAMAVFAICVVMGLALVCVLGVSGFVAYRFVSSREIIARDMAVMNMKMVKEQAFAQQQMLTLNSEQDYLASGITTIVIDNDSTIRMAGKELQLHGIGEAISQHLANAGRNVITAKRIRVVVSPVSSSETVGTVIQACLRAGITIEQITDSGIVIPPTDTQLTSDSHDAHAHADDEAHSHDESHAHGESDHAEASAAEPAAEADLATEAVEGDAEAAVETVEH